jgi:hypothetical protein
VLTMHDVAANPSPHSWKWSTPVGSGVGPEAQGPAPACHAVSLEPQALSLASYRGPIAVPSDAGRGLLLSHTLRTIIPEKDPSPELMPR